MQLRATTARIPGEIVEVCQIIALRMPVAAQEVNILLTWAMPSVML